MHHSCVICAVRSFAYSLRQTGEREGLLTALEVGLEEEERSVQHVGARRLNHMFAAPWLPKDTLACLNDVTDVRRVTRPANISWLPVVCCVITGTFGTHSLQALEPIHQ